MSSSDLARIPALAQPAEGTETLDELVLLLFFHFTDLRFFFFLKKTMGFEQNLDAGGVPRTGSDW